MRIKVGDVSQKIGFVAVDATDGFTRETGMSGFTVYYSLNSGTATAMTTPTTEALDDTNMPGVYTLAIDEAGMTSAGGELLVHISAAGMAPVTTSIEIVDNFESDIISALATHDGKLDTVDANVDSIISDTTAILIDTNELQGDWTDGGRLDLILDAIIADTGTDGVVLTSAERNAVADAILDRDMSTGTDSGSATVRTVRQALRSNRNKIAIASGTLTVYKEDDSTASWTADVVTTSGNPISSIDPANS